MCGACSSPENDSPCPAHASAQLRKTDTAAASGTFTTSRTRFMTVFSTSFDAFDWPKGNHRPLPFEDGFFETSGGDRHELLEDDRERVGDAAEGPASFSEGGGTKLDELG